MCTSKICMYVAILFIQVFKVGKLYIIWYMSCLHSHLIYAYQSFSVTVGLCPNLDDLSNGMINCSSNENQEHIYEHTCHFTCKTGYQLTGSDTRTCQSNGSWSGNETECQRGQLHYAYIKQALLDLYVI